MGADNSAAFERLQKAIDKLARLGELPDQVAADCVAPFERMMLDNIAQNVSPNGKPWPSGVSGKPVLLGAGKALKVTNRGPVLQATLTGPEARHHLGAVWGTKRRQILPSKGSLGGLSKILKRMATKRWRASIGDADQ